MIDQTDEMKARDLEKIACEIVLLVRRGHFFEKQDLKPIIEKIKEYSHSVRQAEREKQKQIDASIAVNIVIEKAGNSAHTVDQIFHAILNQKGQEG